MLTELNEERLVLPAIVSTTEKTSTTNKGEVRIVSQMAEPFRLEGLWEEEDVDDGDVAVEKKAIEA